MNQVVVIVGMGNMGRAMLKGLNSSEDFKGYNIFLYEARNHSLEDYLTESRISILKDPDDFSSKPFTIVLCINPHDLIAFANSINSLIHKDSLIISILAGTSLATIAEQTKHKGAIVRAMPNIGATIGQAATVLCANKVCSAGLKDQAFNLFESVGDAFWAKEEQLDTVTGLSGSGPAYIYMVIEALTDGGVKMGLARDLARALATQTVLGAASLVKSTGLHPAILKDQVTTPAGTTISALHELEERGLRSMFVSAVEIATERSKILGSTKS